MKATHLVVAVSLCVTTVVVGAYAVAASAAAAMAAGFSPVETTDHASIATSSSALKRAVADHRMARAKCKLLAGDARNLCNDAVREQDKHAFSAHQL